MVVVDGTSDDLDLPIKACFMDSDFVRRHRLTSINSINWARIMVQMVHYFYSYFQVSTLFANYSNYNMSRDM